MLEDNLRILQLNIMKSRAYMEALINDHQSQKLDMLMIQEPSITGYRTHVNHSAWRIYQPTVESVFVRFRSLMHVNRKPSYSSLGEPRPFGRLATRGEIPRSTYSLSSPSCFMNETAEQMA